MWFRSDRRPAAPPPAPGNLGPDLSEIAAMLLVSAAPPSPLGLALTAEEAQFITRYMVREKFAEGGTVVFGGQSEHVPRLMLVLDGEVSVEDFYPVAVLNSAGPGSTLGKVNLFDPLAQPLVMSAMTDVRVATLTREALRQLFDDAPLVAAKYMLQLSAELATLTADSMKRMTVMSQLVRALQEELASDPEDRTVIDDAASLTSPSQPADLGEN